MREKPQQQDIPGFLQFFRLGYRIIPMTERTTQPKLAVLIDAENAQYSIIENLLAEIAKYGIASTKRIYGDWTHPKLKGWKDTLLKYSMQPFQQFEYTRGKNSSDSALIIDAMDLLYSENFDGFCIVSSDSDFTRLAARLREAGMTVYGFGEKKTPEAFRVACDKFIFTEILREEYDEDEAKVSAKQKNAAAELMRNTKIINLIRSAVDACADDSGWAYLGSIGQFIAKKSPDFDSRNYGFKKLVELLDAVKQYEKDERTLNNAPGKLIYFRKKKRKRR